MILTINGGSSSIKFSVYEDQGAAAAKPAEATAQTAEATFQPAEATAQPAEARFQPLVKGKIERIGLPGTHFDARWSRTPDATNPKVHHTRQAVAKLGDHADVREAAKSLLAWIDSEIGFDKIEGIGHRIVHGLDLQHAVLIDTEVLHKLKSIRTVDPDHLPGEIQLIEIFQHQHHQIKQVACFDTAFHATLPKQAYQLPLPRKFEAMGIRRYGFHGLSYAYLCQALRKLAPAVAEGRVIMAHLGNGASMTALYQGKSVDTSMGFSPVGGFMMGTRTGDLDPGLVRYLMRKEDLSPTGFNDLVNHQSGLLGVSETSSDVRDLMEKEASDSRAAEALTLFCYQVKKWIGSFAAALGGIDALVFSGGIGENAPLIRERVCQDLSFLGIALDTTANGNNRTLISSGPTKVYVIPTNEEIMIARITAEILK
jgi:acetate kinase